VLAVVSKTLFAGTTSGLDRLPIVAARCLSASANGIVARKLDGGTLAEILPVLLRFVIDNSSLTD
jgi:hypothetical protein